MRKVILVMPLENFESLCNKHAAQIVSKDKRNPQYHKGNNSEMAYVTHYRIDGIVIREGIRCDFLLINEDRKVAYLIELKGSDLERAAEQLKATEDKLKRELSGYSLRYRIVAKKCRTQAITSTTYKKYQLQWKGKLIQKTGFIEEQI